MDKLLGPKRRAYDFIAANRAGSLATVNSDGIPHVAIVYCIIKKDLTLYFSTRVEGRKYKNLSKQPTVSMAFYSEPTLQMIQLTGKTERIDDYALEQETMRQLLQLRYQDPGWPLLPPVQLFERGATNEIAVMRLTPGELTFADFSTSTTGHYKAVFQKII